MFNLQCKGFSLIELNIILIILGLLISGSLYFSKLIKLTETKKLVKELTDYKLAFHNFYEVYQAFPGDINRGGLLFEDEYCLDNPPSNKNSCNGNGNNFTDIENISEKYEIIRAFYHLHKAELLFFNNLNRVKRDLIDHNSLNCSSLLYEVGYNFPKLANATGAIIFSKLSKNSSKSFYHLEFLIRQGKSCDFNNLDGSFSKKQLEFIELKYDNQNYENGNFRVKLKNCFYNNNYNDVKSLCDLTYLFNLGEI